MNLLQYYQSNLEYCSICGNHHSGLCSYEISYFTYYPDSQNQIPRTVELVGSWYKWQNHERMDKKIDMKGHICFSTGSNVPIGKFEYKFLVDGRWAYDKQAPTIADPFGSFNNIIEVLPKKALVQYTHRQDIKISSSLAMKDLKIIGSWDNWTSETTMQLGYNNLKGCQENFVYMELIPQMHYEFKFKYNNTYLIDEKYPTVVNQFGSQNNRIFVCNEKNTPIHWLPQSVSSHSFSCRSFEWEKVQVQSNLSQYKRTLYGHTMSQIGQHVYIFGGLIHNDFTNRLTKVNIHKLGCMQAQEIESTKRAFHCAAVYGNKMIIFGGINTNVLQDYHTFNSSDRTWAPSPQIKGKAPSKRQKQTCVLYKTLLVFFGGYYCSSDIQFESTYNDIQVLDIQQMKWVDEELINVNGPLPSARFSHASALIHSKMYIFGGKNVNNEKGFSCYTNFNDLWVMDLQTVSNLHWEELKPKGKPPAQRHGHSMNALQEFLIIFGGQGEKKEMRYNDVVVFDTVKKQWIYPIIKGKTIDSQPSARVYHGSTSIDNESIVIFGGKNINQKSTAFYVLKPKDIKFDIEQEDEFSDSQSEDKDVKVESMTRSVVSNEPKSQKQKLTEQKQEIKNLKHAQI